MPLKCYCDTLLLGVRNNEVIDCIFVDQQTIYNKDISLRYENEESTGIRFDECIMFAIPSSESIKEFIPNVTVLSIQNSKIFKFASDDLQGFDCLRDLYVNNCELEYLPGDLFKHTPDLEYISFYGNKIKYIDEDILNPLRNLKMFDLRGNVNINACFNIVNIYGDSYLEDFIGQLREQFINGIKTKCKTPWKKASDEQQEEITAMKANDEVQKKEIANLKENYEDLKKKLVAMSQQFQVIKQVSKNFTVKVNEKHFSVHKAILIDHSQVLAKLITENPEADVLELKDISEAAFQEILNFMNDGSRPTEDANMVELFGASCRLKIEALTIIAVNRLKKEVNQVNALDVLVIGNKFNNYVELKMRAFAEFQKSFPNQILNAELASQPEKLKALVKAKLDMDKIVAEIKVE